MEKTYWRINMIEKRTGRETSITVLAGSNDEARYSLSKAELFGVDGAYTLTGVEADYEARLYHQPDKYRKYEPGHYGPSADRRRVIAI